MTLALVTGASRGIGAAVALELARRGVDLLVVGRPSDELAGVRARCVAEGVTCEWLLADLADAREAERLGDELAARPTAVDAVVHSAGIIERAEVVELGTASWDRHMAVNLRAPFVITRAVLPRMLARRSGRVVFVGSISSTVGSPRASAYCASKWGLVGFMKSLAAELSDTGVSTCAVLPGSVDTRMLVGSGFAPRMSASDVARTVVFHALDASAAHNGASIEMFGV